VIRRWVFNVAAAVSLLFCATTIVLWVTSWFTSKPLAHYWLTINGWIYDIWLSPRPFGFKWRSGVFGVSPCTDISAPYWFAIILSGTLPVLWTVSTRRSEARRRRAEAGLCVVCDYSLVANTSGVCPECGTPVPNKPEAVA